jgi:hypothetical protein
MLPMGEEAPLHIGEGTGVDLVAVESRQFCCSCQESNSSSWVVESVA